jgi:hypothetical protein
MADAGGAYAVNRRRESAAQIEGTIGAGDTGQLGGDGVALTARAKGGPHIAQGALGVSVYMLAGPRWIHARTERGIVLDPGTGPPAYAFFLLGGATLIQLESVSGEFAAGTLGPNGKLGLWVRMPRESVGITFSLAAQYDRRWTDTPDTSFMVFAIGLGEIHYGGGETFVIGPD